MDHDGTRGAEWGRPQLARVAHNPRKLAIKLLKLAVRYEARDKRLAALPPIYRMVYDWLPHLPGSLRWWRMAMAVPLVRPETDSPIQQAVEETVDPPLDYTRGSRNDWAVLYGGIFERSPRSMCAMTKRNQDTCDETPRRGSRQQETPDEALRRNMRRLKTEGLDAATEAAIALLRDPETPAQARSATINAVYRAAGLFGSAVDDEENVQPHEMTAEQLQRAIAKIGSKM